MRNYMMWMLHFLLFLALALCATCGGGGDTGNPPPPPPPPPGNAIQVTLQPTQVFQTWEAWAVSASGPQFLDNTGTSQPLPSAMLSNILDDLVNDLGLNGLRLQLHHAQNIELTNDDSDPNHIVWSAFDFGKAYRIASNEPVDDPLAKMNQVVVPFKQRVEARGEPFVSYVSLIYKWADFPNHWHTPAEYAELAEAHVTWLQNKSPTPPGFMPITPTYWVIVNEPDGGGFGASELANDIIAVGNRFSGLVQRGVIPTNIKIQTVESVTPNSALLNGVLSTPGVSPFVSMVSYHGYDYNSLSMPASFSQRNAIRTAAQGINARTAMTEICCHTGWDGSYTQALGWVRDIYWNMTEANISTWQPLAMMFTCRSVGCSPHGQDPIMIEPDFPTSSTYHKFEPYYALRQYSKFIRPGYKRLGFTCGNCSTDVTLGQNVKPVAFQSPAGKIVAVVINDQSVAQSISLLGLPAGTYDILGVDPANSTSPVAYPAQTIGASQALTVSFPAQSILTFTQR